MSQPDPRDPEPDQPEGRIGTTGPRPLVVAGVAGLVAGWAVRPVALQTGLPEPRVPLTAIAVLFLMAALVGGTAYVTRRTLRRSRFDLPHHQAVNRLVLGKACAIAGALVLGGYLGYAVSQLGVSSPAAGTRLWRSLVAAAAGLLLMVLALLLELACRVPKRDD